MKNVVKEIISTILYILAVLLGTYLLITFVGQRTSVSGSSMEPTLSNNDQLILDKISYRFSEPKRFDIIVFPFQYKENTYYVKRVIGLPGETVQIDLEGNIYINGEILVEDYGKEKINFPGLAVEPLHWGMMNILSWVITGTTARTAGIQAWGTSGAATLSVRPG